MPIHHIILFKLKPSTSAEKITALQDAARAMVGQVPGLKKVDIGPPLASTAHRSQGFDMGLVALLEKAEDVAVYAAHPAHMVVHKLREEICTDTLAYDLEF